MDGAEGGRKEETRGYGIMTGDVVRPILHVVATYAHRVSDSWRMMRKGSRLGSPVSFNVPGGGELTPAGDSWGGGGGGGAPTDYQHHNPALCPKGLPAASVR